MGLRDRVVEHPTVATALAVQKRYRHDAADQLAAAISFFGFVSVFPLLALSLAAAGYVLDDPEDQVRFALALTDAIPGFDALLADDDGAPGVAALVQNVVARRGTIGLIGLASLLLAGLKIVAAAMAATRVVFRGAVVAGIRGRVRQLAAMVGLGVLALLAVGGSSIAGTGGALFPPPLAFLIALAVAFALDFVLFLGAYTLLSPTSTLSVRQLVPGAVVGALGWAVLKVVGASYVGNQVDGANALYGALGGVIGLLLLFYLAGRLYLYGAELSAVLIERRYGPLRGPADAKIEEVVVPAGDTGAGSPRRAVTRGTADQVRAPDPGPATPMTTRDATRERLAAAERERVAAETVRDHGADARRTVAFALAAAALAAAWRFLGPSRR